MAVAGQLQLIFDRFTRAVSCWRYVRETWNVIIYLVALSNPRQARCCPPDSLARGEHAWLGKDALVCNVHRPRASPPRLFTKLQNGVLRVCEQGVIWRLIF